MIKKMDEGGKEMQDGGQRHLINNNIMGLAQMADADASLLC